MVTTNTEKLNSILNKKLAKGSIKKIDVIYKTRNDFFISVYTTQNTPTTKYFYKIGKDIKRFLGLLPEVNPSIPYYLTINFVNTKTEEPIAIRRIN